MSTEYTIDLTNANETVGSGGNINAHYVQCVTADASLYYYAGASYPVSITVQQVPGPVISYNFLMPCFTK